MHESCVKMANQESQMARAFKKKKKKKSASKDLVEPVEQKRGGIATVSAVSKVPVICD